MRQFHNRFVARAVRIDGPASALGIEALCVFFPNPRCRVHRAFFERISRKKGIEERTGQIIFVKTTLSLSFSFKDVVASNRDAAGRILEFLGVPFAHDFEIAPPTVQKQAIQLSEEWTAAYLELKEKIGWTSLPALFDASEPERG